ncbi:DinB family protein [Bacillus sp. FJAT-49732]|uniref:DinB family protein n=1 Tax=Lederbergia citrisecunda TaxID=2833583 RepID=A0A942TMP5_9BACI|nr:DinB family protein [Lederbergia citrisecunda]MBS4200168.1 DinB family protein [Lederbergia citrisecunda]
MDIKLRKTWNENHKILSEIILKRAEHTRAIQLFLSQHSLLHSSSISETPLVTLEDEMLKNLDETTFRQYPVPNPDTKNSIAWHLWHITRIEDMTMNILLSNEQQVLFAENWLEKMNIGFTHSGNDMSEKEIALMSSKIDINSLKAYRTAVGKRTRQVVSSLQPGQFKGKVEQNRIKRLFEENAVSQNSKWLADYWSKKNIAGLILMPATRHIFLHLNKCIRIKDRLHKLQAKPK